VCASILSTDVCQRMLTYATEHSGPACVLAWMDSAHDPHCALYCARSSLTRRRSTLFMTTQGMATSSHAAVALSARLEPIMIVVKARAISCPSRLESCFTSRHR
jgi:hypothetical protein